jgi:hypothetical protein
MLLFLHAFTLIALASAWDTAKTPPMGFNT